MPEPSAAAGAALRASPVGMDQARCLADLEPELKEMPALAEMECLEVRGVRFAASKLELTNVMDAPDRFSIAHADLLQTCWRQS